MLEIVRRLREVRKLKKMSQLELSRRIGVHKTYISQIENGIHNPSLKVTYAWCRALGCELNVIIKDLK